MSLHKPPDHPPHPDGPLDHRIVVDNIIQAMSDGVVVISPQGKITRVNRAMCEIVGLRAEDMLGRGWAELFFDREENLAFNQTVVEVIQSHQSVHNRPVSFVAPDGRRRELIATTSLIREEGRIIGLVGVFKDITELSLLHERERRLLAHSMRLYEEKLESLDRVARAVAHEVRNPVTAIGGLANRLLKLEPPGSRAAEYLQRILEAAARLERVVTQVRAYAYVPRPVRRRVEVQAWLGELLEPYQERALAQEVDLRLEVESDAPVVAEMDPHLMATALRNLLDNALEAMPVGGALYVGLRREGSDVVITIRDTGPGIPEEHMPYLFDPFFTTKADRVGMSLAITKRIVSDHDGLLEFTSPPPGYNTGTLVTITLPPPLQHMEVPVREPQLK